MKKFKVGNIETFYLFSQRLKWSISKWSEGNHSKMRSFKLNTMYDIKITKTTFQHTFKSDQIKKLQSQLL